jgi:hypothetical protein
MLTSDLPRSQTANINDLKWYDNNGHNVMNPDAFLISVQRPSTSENPNAKVIEGSYVYPDLNS